jgi:hypothetical protein
MAGSFALTGCVAPEGPYVAVAKPDGPEASGAPVVLLNYDLKRTLAVDRPPIVVRNPNGHMTIQVGLRNRTDDESLQLQVQTMFMDDTGRVLYSQLGSEAAWQTITVSPNQTVHYTAAALSPEATRFTVRVRHLARAY